MKEDVYFDDSITYNTFINPDFRFHSQLTDCDTIEPGLDFEDTLENLENYFNNILNSLKQEENKSKYTKNKCKKLYLNLK